MKNLDAFLTRFAFGAIALGVAILAAIVVSQCAEPAHAARARHVSGQWLFGQSDVDVPSHSTRCYALSGGSTVPGSATVGQRGAPWIAGTFSALSFRVHVDTAHDIGGAEHSATGTLMVNGAPTALSSTIRGGPGFEREARVDVDTLTVRDGDLVELCVATGLMPSRSDQLHWSVRFESESGEYVYPSVILAGGSSAQHVRALGTAATAGGATEAATQFVIPLDGAIRRMLCSGPRSWTLRRNGADAISCGGPLLPITAGDLVSLRMGTGSGSGVAGVTFTWVPTEPGAWFLASSGGGWSPTLTRYQRLHGPQGASSTRYSAHATPLASNAPAAPYVTVTGMHAAVDAAPGAGSWSVELVEYPTQDTSGAPHTARGACAIGGAARTCATDLDETARIGSRGPSWYELRLVPIGAPRAASGKAAIAVRTVDDGAPAPVPVAERCWLDRCSLDVATLF